MVGEVCYRLIDFMLPIIKHLSNPRTEVLPKGKETSQPLTHLSSLLVELDKE